MGHLKWLLEKWPLFTCLLSLLRTAALELWTPFPRYGMKVVNAISEGSKELRSRGWVLLLVLGVFLVFFHSTQKVSYFSKCDFPPCRYHQKKLYVPFALVFFSSRSTGSVLASSMTKILTVGISLFKFFILSLSCLGSSTPWYVFPYLCGCRLKPLEGLSHLY